jgi:hypothetical protein
MRIRDEINGFLRIKFLADFISTSRKLQDAEVVVKTCHAREWNPSDL